MATRSGRPIIIVKKKVTGHGGHHGGAWKVAYADFVTAMMAFFMVMWILGMDDKTKMAIEGYFANPVGYKKGYGAGSSPLSSGSTPSNVQKTQLRMIVRSTEMRTFEQVKQQILDKVAKNDSLRALNALIDVQVTADGLRIELVETGTGDVYFPIGSAKMKSATMLALQLIGPELAKLQHPVVLEGEWPRDKVVIMEFPDDAAAQEFLNSPEYQEISVDRKAGADAIVLTVRGLS